jgi:hypothetical protein
MARCLLIRFSSTGVEKGFEIKSATPMIKPWASVAGSLLPVRNITGISA